MFVVEGRVVWEFVGLDVQALDELESVRGVGGGCGMGGLTSSSISKRVKPPYLGSLSEGGWGGCEEPAIVVLGGGVVAVKPCNVRLWCHREVVQYSEIVAMR